MLQTNQEKITKEFCLGKRLIFYPKTEQEAALIQRKFFDMGFRWSSGSAEVMRLDDCVSHGVLLTAESVLYHSPSSSSTETGLLCTSAQFDENHLSPEMTFMMTQFNQLAAQLKELARAVAEIKKELQPQRLDKPVVKKPENGSP